MPRLVDDHRDHDDHGCGGHPATANTRVGVHTGLRRLLMISFT